MSDKETEEAQPGLAFRLQAENQTNPEWVSFSHGQSLPTAGRKKQSVLVNSGKN